MVADLKQAADAVTDKNAGLLGISVVYFKLGFVHRLKAGGNRHLGKPVHAVCFLTADIVQGVKPFYFGGKLGLIG